MLNLQKYRKREGLTQKELADLVGVTHNTIWRWETGKAAPKISDIEKLAEVLQVTTKELIDGPSENALKVSFIWEVESMNPIAMNPNEFNIGYSGNQFLFWGSLPQEMTPDEICDRIKKELIAAAAGAKARRKSLEKQERSEQSKD